MVNCLYGGTTGPLGFQGGCLSYCDDELSKAHNIKLALRWIPIIGALIGAYQLYTNWQSFKEEYEKEPYARNKEEYQYLRGEMIRSGFEVATLGCIGPIMMIIDLICTLGRACTLDPY